MFIDSCVFIVLLRAFRDFSIVAKLTIRPVIRFVDNKLRRAATVFSNVCVASANCWQMCDSFSDIAS